MSRNASKRACLIDAFIQLLIHFQLGFQGCFQIVKCKIAVPVITMLQTQNMASIYHFYYKYLYYHCKVNPCCIFLIFFFRRVPCTQASKAIRTFRILFLIKITNMRLKSDALNFFMVFLKLLSEISCQMLLYRTPRTQASKVNKE